MYSYCALYQYWGKPKNYILFTNFVYVNCLHRIKLIAWRNQRFLKGYLLTLYTLIGEPSCFCIYLQ